LVGHLKAMVVRVPHIAALLAFNLSALRAFGVQVPLAAAIASLPVVMFIAVLPISGAGSWHLAAAMVFFVARYVPPSAGDPKAVVLAASLAAQFMATTVQVLIGLLCMRTRTARGLGEAAKQAAWKRSGAVPPVPPVRAS
jgi:hypothetical protein